MDSSIACIQILGLEHSFALDSVIESVSCMEVPASHLIVALSYSLLSYSTC